MAEHWLRQQIIKIILNAMVDAGAVKAVPAGQAADAMLDLLEPVITRAALDEFANRVVYNLQLSNGRLCAVLEKIATGDPNAQELAKKALAAKPKWNQPPDNIRTVIEQTIDTLAAGRHLFNTHVPDHHWLSEHTKRIDALKLYLKDPDAK